MRALLFSSRRFQRRVIDLLREEVNDGHEQGVAFTEEVLLDLMRRPRCGPALSEDEKKRIQRAIRELVHEDILVSVGGPWKLGQTVKLNRGLLRGESVTDRLERLPKDHELSVPLVLLGWSLVALTLTLFFYFCFNFVAESWEKPLTGAFALIGLFMGLAGLKYGDVRSITGQKWKLTTLAWWGGGLVAAAGLVGFGWLHPVVVRATPGAEIHVDGHLYRTVAGVSGDDQLKPEAWFKLQEVKLWLTWESHDIVVKKKWYRAKGLATEVSERVGWPPGDPVEVITRPMIQIRADEVLTKLERRAWRLEGDGAEGADKAAEADAGQMRKLAKEWSVALRKQLFDGAASPFPQNELRVEAWVRKNRRGVLAYGIYDLAGTRLVTFTPIEVADVTDAALWNLALANVLQGLEQELDMEGLDETVTVVGALELPQNSRPKAEDPVSVLQATFTTETGAVRQPSGVTGEQAVAIAAATAAAGSKTDDGKKEVATELLAVATRSSNNPPLVSAALQAARQVSEGLKGKEAAELETKIKTAEGEVKTSAEEVGVTVVISEEAQREKADDLVLELSKKGTRAEVQSVEGADYAESETAVKYFVKTKGTEAAAEKAIAALDSVGGLPEVTNARVESAAATELATEDVSNQVEIYLGKDAK